MGKGTRRQYRTRRFPKQAVDDGSAQRGIILDLYRRAFGGMDGQRRNKEEAADAEQSARQ
jgi:hypothetical protein